MNTHVPIDAASRAATGSTRPKIRFENYLGKPDGAERLREEIETRFNRDHPRLVEIPGERSIIEKARKRLEKELDRRFDAKANTDLIRQRWGEVSIECVSFFDRVRFAGFVAASALCLAMDCGTLARYVEDSGVIASLDGNFWGALLFSAAPFSGAFGLKAIGEALSSNKQKRRFLVVLGAVGLGALAVQFLGMSVAFAPQPIDAGAIGDQLEKGLAAEQHVKGIADIAAMLTIAAGLIAETCLSPVIMWAAEKLDQAKRKLIVTDHDAQGVHNNAIAAIMDEIKRLGRQDAELTAEEAGLRLDFDTATVETLEKFNLLDANVRREWARTINKFRSKRDEEDTTP